MSFRRAADRGPVVIFSAAKILGARSQIFRCAHDDKLRRSVTKICLVWMMLLSGSVRADWPDFRGPTRAGHAPSGLPLQWSETKNVRWKTPIPHRGWSTPIVLDKQIWL